MGIIWNLLLMYRNSIESITIPSTTRMVTNFVVTASSVFEVVMQWLGVSSIGNSNVLFLEGTEESDVEETS